MADVTPFDDFNSAVARIIEAGLRARAEALERKLRDWGECLWTCRDVIVVVDRPGHASEVVAMVTPTLRGGAVGSSPGP